jgi:hypothetical protein
MNIRWENTNYLAHHNAKCYDEKYSVGIHRSVEKKIITKSSHAAGMRPA